MTHDLMMMFLTHRKSCERKRAPSSCTATTPLPPDSPPPRAACLRTGAAAAVPVCGRPPLSAEGCRPAAFGCAKEQERSPSTRRA